MHQLSVIIVNYNVKHFLEQALVSVFKSVQNLDAEVWVVDNNSVDGSMEMVKNKFPSVKTICNAENVGFSKANNQAISQSNSEFVLLLNPDTVLQEDTLSKCVDYLKQNAEVGALGVRMIDGKGNFLPESKRGLPTPKVAFFKMTGLSALFPKSKLFGRYHMKYLSEFETHEVEVLSGAFMMMRNEALNKVGLLDEDFFMYGEDIDLSYRIILGGYKNVYFADTTIIHYKGESTKKKSVNYVKVFYNAMVLFAQKHYSQKMAGWFAFWVNLAIYFRAFLALAWRGLQSIFLPTMDTVAIYLGYWGIAHYWELYHKYVRNFYPPLFYFVHIPWYSLIVVLGVLISGGYDKPFHSRRLFRGIVAGSIALILIYAFLPKNFQFSRAILALGSAWSMGVLFALRLFAQQLRIGNIHLTNTSEKRIVVVGHVDEAIRIEDLLKRSQVNHQMMGWVCPTLEKKDGFLGNISQLSEIIEIYNANLIIFSGRDVSANFIMKTMTDFAKTEVQLKIAPDKGESIIGSNSKNDPGELFTVELKYNIADRSLQRRKRIFDVLMALTVLVFSPILVILGLIYKNCYTLIVNALSVLIGIKTWVSYQGMESSEVLPKLKPGVFKPGTNYQNTIFEWNWMQLYAREYSVVKDLFTVTQEMFKR